MALYTPSIDEMISRFETLPGIGPKSAERIAFSLLKKSDADMEAMARSLLAVKEKVKVCRRCFSYCEGESLCAYCRDPARANGQLCVVEEAKDMIAIERAGVFKGKYHVLQGRLSPLDGVRAEHLRFQELRDRLQNGEEKEIQEVVCATNATVLGDATALYIKELLKGFSQKVTRLAQGMPSGGEMEFADDVTLHHAFSQRAPLE